ncbi:MAG TPA: arylsulfotransferase family protein [Solirubrobacteraceae bacterium]|nr:arylsulfotransferase family protein [Solirubrobacteraceae bacterium]
MQRPSAPRALRAGLTALVALAGVAGGVVALSSAHSAGAPPARAPNCVPPHLNVSAALAGERVTVSPGPETMDASAQTQISMLGVPARELSDVTVTGSRSGRHAGRLLAYSQGDGASFLPSRPFRYGERVSVHAELREGTRTIPFAWRFTVAVRDTPGSSSAAVVGVAKNPHATPTAAPTDYQSFHSRPELRPPDVTVSPTARTATGEVLIAPYAGVGQYGPMVLNEHGELIWFKALAPLGTRAGNLRVQEYEGQPVLTWWQDPLIADGSRTSGDVIANSAYQTIKVVRAGNGYQPDLHEFQITPQGTALITVYDAIDCNLKAVGGPADGAVADTLLQEIDLKTGLVMYEWHSLDHVPLSNSYSSPRTTSKHEPFDYFHINSIDVERDGDLLVGSRNTWAAYDVDPKTGQVRWELGGKRSSFKLGPGTDTAWQHDAVQLPGGQITFFDNGASPQVQPQSRAIEIALDTRAMTATLVRSYAHRKPLVADSQGNVQVTSAGDWMVGWGQAEYFSEIDAAGRLLFDAHLPPNWESYRAFVAPWSGHPTQPPALAAETKPGSGRGATVYASWNGATDVASWQVLAGATPGSLKPAVSAAKRGFETAIALPGAALGSYVAVQARGASGAVIGTSRTVAVKAGA